VVDEVGEVVLLEFTVLHLVRVCLLVIATENFSEHVSSFFNSLSKLDECCFLVISNEFFLFHAHSNLVSLVNALVLESFNVFLFVLIVENLSGIGSEAQTPIDNWSGARDHWVTRRFDFTNKFLKFSVMDIDLCFIES